MNAPSIQTRPLGTNQAGTASLVWLAAAAGVSFLTTAIFAGLLQLPRAWFLVPYFGIVLALIAAYVRTTGTDLGAAFRERWLRGVLAGAVFSVFLVRNVLSQPGSGPAEGAELALQLAWFGVAYGLIDALLLSVVPVLAVERAFGVQAGRPSRAARLGIDAAALVVSCALAAVYHLGYPEFRGATLLWPIIGNGVITLSYLVSRSPVAPVLAHVIMHTAAVLHGPDSTVQLPPHY